MGKHKLDFDHSALSVIGITAFGNRGETYKNYKQFDAGTSFPVLVMRHKLTDTIVTVVSRHYLRFLLIFQYKIYALPFNHVENHRGSIETSISSPRIK